ncbi:MAG: peptide chain release factor N(5)-glutamine methyltransferase [Verrucomicrobiota bacterium]
MTVLEAIQKSADFLAKKGVTSSRLNAELLLAHLLQMPRMKLYLNFDRVLAAAETDALRALIKRRGQREPLQHITGSTSFCGLEIIVNRHALVPRPETELLAELGWQYLLALNPTPVTVLDFGTGTGCIALAIAAKCPAARITALDVSPEALELARENTLKNQVAQQIEFLPGDGFAVLAEWCGRPQGPEPNSRNGLPGISLPQFDLIVSNPPYIASAEISTLEPEVRDFDPSLALDGGVDGLEFYRRLAVGTRPFLKPAGKIMLEFGDGQAEAIKKILTDENWIVEAVREDYSHRARILVARR